MKITVDGIIYQVQRVGGVSRLFSEILPRMCEIEEQLSIELFTVGPLARSVPVHQRIRYRSIPQLDSFLRPNRLFQPILPPLKRFVKRLYYGEGRGRIWHSTYFSSPEKWKGKQVVTVHDMIYELFQDMYDDTSSHCFRKAKAHCIESADAIICVSETTRNDLKKYFDLTCKDTHVVYPAAAEIFRRLSPDEIMGKRHAEKPFILYVGMRSHNKNFNLLADGYRLWDKRKDIGLVVVGKPWTAEEKKRLEILNIYSDIILLTDIPDDELCVLYNTAMAFIYPSLYEGFGIPLLEAMACGCPLVASRIPPTLEVAGDCPFYFDVKDPESLIYSMDEAVFEGRDGERVKKGVARAGLYSWDKTAAGTLAVYRDLQ